MPTIDRQDSVLNILQNLRDLDGLKRLFWEELNYERENRPLSPRQWPESARQPLAEDPILFATGGEDDAFHVVYCHLESDALLRGHERPIVNCLTREHPYALFVFSNKGRTDWHFLNVKYDEEADKRRLLRRITVRPGEGLRTAAERMQMLDLEAISPDLLGLSPLTIQQQHDDAFDVEKVSKDFYREIANWYFWALKHVMFPKNAPKEQDGRDHISVIRLITRLIFCWFIREKGLIPDVLFDEPGLVEMLDGFAPGKKRNKESVFYRAILQNLFFATLNTEMDQRGWRRADQNFMAHSLYRHKECFRDPKAGLEWFKDIPFLNGGLFECLDRDFGLPAEAPASATRATAGRSAKAGEGAKPRYVRVDGFSDRDDSRPTVPDFLFFGSEQDVDLSEDYGDKKFRSVRVRGLIDTLNRYKFTIEENTPFDQEVALDPELCGKVFENLLAAYNPETGTTARKATGSFYTPREIVDYMVDESLIAYLKGKIEPRMDANERELKKKKTNNLCPSMSIHGSSDERLRALLAYDTEMPAFSEAETEALIEAIDELKALDPAVGSGAFPMGMLHKLVHVLGRLDPDNERWKAKQIAKLDDATMREDAERLFRENYDDYGRKLYLIENCIYGVDIQPIAVQIAKMRFFISLIVDQKVNPKSQNLGVRALPNLETKFVAANTLIGIEKKERQGDFLTEDTAAHQRLKVLREELTEVRHLHFSARTTKTKARCREKDSALREEMSELLKCAGMSASWSRQLAAWDPYDQNAHADFFDPEWMFGVTNGFDIAIGNPPYVRIQTLPSSDAAYLKSHYAAAARGNFDLYVVFVERGLQVLEPQGHLAFILPNKLFNVQYGAPLRALLAKNESLRHVVHFGDQQVFPGATNYVCLLFLARVGVKACRWVRVDDVSRWLTRHAGVETRLPADRFAASEWNFVGGLADSLLEKLRGSGPRLLDLPTDMSRGHSTGADKVFFVDFASHDIEEEILRIPVRATDFARYSYTPDSQWRIIFPYRREDGCFRILPEEELRQLYPRAFHHLGSHRKTLNQRKGAKYWYGFSAPRNLALHDKADILVPLLADTGSFARVPADLQGKLCPMASGGFTISARSCPYRPEYLLALLNSRLLFWMLLRTSNLFHGGWITCTKQYFGELPILCLDLNRKGQREEHDALVKLVDHILAAKAADPTADTSAWEREIDERVYKLYGLTAEEVKIVEGGKR